MLRADILELLGGLRAADPEHHVLRCLNTNGHLVTPELARALVGLADEVRVSLDALPERNDAMRGAGNFESALRALECYYAVGFEPKVLVAAICDERLAFLKALRAWPVFGRGWGTRVAEVRAVSLAFAGATQGVTPSERARTSGSSG